MEAVCASFLSEVYLMTLFRRSRQMGGAECQEKSGDHGVLALSFSDGLGGNGDNTLYTRSDLSQRTCCEYFIFSCENFTSSVGKTFSAAHGES